MREKEGSVLQSNEVVIAVSVLASFLAMAALGKFMLQNLLTMLKTYIANLGSEYTPSIEFVQQNSLEMIKYGIIIVMPLALIIGFVAVLVVLAQTKGMFNMKPVRPKFSRLSPIQGAKRLFSAQSIVGVIKGTLELAIIGVIVFMQIQSRLPDFGNIIDVEPIVAVQYIANSIFDIVMLMCIVLVFIAAGDYVFQWWQFEKKLKMSKQEVKDEYKRSEGDPQIKSKIKQKQREIAQKRMMQDVPTADVVVRNPTHYAVALKYDAKNALGAPKVVAKGMDSLALKIVRVAEENDVYVTENRPLARSLYDGVNLGQEIPPSLYAAVAEVLSEMFSAKGIKPKLSEQIKNSRGARPKIKRNDLGT